jgi:hypothetical protein
MTVLQGAFNLTKAKGDAAAKASNICVATSHFCFTGEP